MYPVTLGPRLRAAGPTFAGLSCPSGRYVHLGAQGPGLQQRFGRPVADVHAADAAFAFFVLYHKQVLVYQGGRPHLAAGEVL